MKTILILFTIFLSSEVYSQDSIEIKRIDSIVYRINTLELQTHRDTILKEYPQVGLKLTTYLTMVLKEKKVVKYENLVLSNSTLNGITSKSAGSNTFYFDLDKLIKVEEYLIEGDENKTAEWYYSESKPLYYTLKSDKAADRAILLLNLSDEILNQLNNK